MLASNVMVQTQHPPRRSVVKCFGSDTAPVPPGIQHKALCKALRQGIFCAIRHKQGTFQPFRGRCKTRNPTIYTAFSTVNRGILLGAMEGTRTPGLLIRSQSLYPAELPTHTFRSEHDVFYHSMAGLSTDFLKYFRSFSKRTSFRPVCRGFFRAYASSASCWAIRTPVGVAARPPCPVSRRSGERRLPTRPMASMTSSQGMA